MNECVSLLKRIKFEKFVPNHRLGFKLESSLCMQMGCGSLLRVRDLHFYAALCKQYLIAGTYLQLCSCRKLLFLISGGVACLIHMLFINLLC